MEEEMDIWDGLPCPPMDDYAFNFTDLDHGQNATGIITNLDPDVFFDEPLQEKKTEKQTIVINKFPKKDLKKLAILLEQDIDPVAYSRELALEWENLDRERAASDTPDADHKEGTICNKTQPQQPIRNIEVVTKKIGVVSKNPQAPSIKQEKELVNNNVFSGKSCEDKKDCNKNMMKKPTIMRKQGKGKELRKVFEVMKPLMEADAYEKAVKYAKAEMEKAKLKATKRKLHESYERINNSKKQRTIKLIEFQPPVPMSKPKIQKPNPTIQKPMPAIQKTKPKTERKLRTSWSSRLAKAVADICS